MNKQEWFSRVRDQDLSVIDEAWAEKWNVNVENLMKETAFKIAIREDYPLIWLEKLIQAGLDLDQEDPVEEVSLKQWALKEACEKNNAALTLFLMKFISGDEVKEGFKRRLVWESEVQSKVKKVPWIVLVCLLGSDQVLKCLIDQWTTEELQNMVVNGVSILDVVLTREDQECLKILLRKGLVVPMDKRSATLSDSTLELIKVYEDFNALNASQKEAGPTGMRGRL